MTSRLFIQGPLGSLDLFMNDVRLPVDVDVTAQYRGQLEQLNTLLLDFRDTLP